MNPIKIHTIKPATILPAHETASRRTRAQILPFPRKNNRPAPPPAPARVPIFDRKSQLLDNF